MITIPERFKKKLEQGDNELLASIILTIKKFESILERNVLEFFPEYTCHGEKHIQWVLDFEDELITEESMDILKPKDIGVLILGTIAHDLGMCITHDGLKVVMDSEKVIEGLDDKTWKELWDDFFEDARRYSDKKIKSIFGEVKNFKIKNPNIDKLDDNDKLLYGEFLRKFHHRLAHEIVLQGFPKINNSYTSFINKIEDIDVLDECDKDIIGILARSHGMDIRDTMDYLKNNYGHYHRPNDICIFYLMSLIRIADYMHVGSDRAPHLLRNISNMKSPISLKEWDWNEAVKYNIRGDIDSELLYVECNPQNSDIYIKIENWIKDMQRELDTCWAILGQAYGGIKELSNLKFTIRRFDSNIIKKKSLFEKKFIPKMIKFDFDPDLLKLLIAPLYGDNPSYGVRELIQNSVDACREREYLNKDKKYIPEINLTIKNDGNDEYYFIISDNGVGMTEKTLINYFLKAGASFRRDSDWMKKFKDKKGKTKIQRNGKFGIGVLASFLLGSRIEVTTKHFKAKRNEGLFFETEIDTEQIEVKKVECELGTTIKIKLDSDKYTELMNQCDNNSYDFRVNSSNVWYSWYRSKYPKINYNLPDEWKIQTILDNPQENELPENWYKIKSDEFQDIKWTYGYGTWKSRWNLCCNGIVIPHGYSIDSYTFPDFSTPPRISVYDYEGNLELSLDRNDLNDSKLPFEKELGIDICKDIIAKLLVTPDIVSKSGIIREVKFNHKALGSEFTRGDAASQYIIFRDGYCLSNSYNIDKLGKRKITCVWADKELKLNNKILNLENGIILKYETISKTNYKYILERESLIVDKEYKINTRRFYMDKAMYKTLTNETKSYLTKRFKKSITQVEEGEKYVCVDIEKTLKSEVNFKNLNKSDAKLSIIEYDLKECEFDDRYVDIFSDIMSKYIGDDVIIPFSLDERKKKYPKAFEELDKYMKAYINVKK